MKSYSCYDWWRQRAMLFINLDFNKKIIKMNLFWKSFANGLLKSGIKFLNLFQQSLILKDFPTSLNGVYPNLFWWLRRNHVLTKNRSKCVIYVSNGTNIKTIKWICIEWKFWNLSELKIFILEFMEIKTR